MEKYNYLENMKSDIIDYLNYDCDFVEIDGENLYYAGDYAELAEKLQDELFVNDNITGNASGSYTFCTYTAEEYICHNLDLFTEACDEFGIDAGEEFKKGAENMDVTIRCYLLPYAIDKALDEFEIIETEEE